MSLTVYRLSRPLARRLAAPTRLLITAEMVNPTRIVIYERWETTRPVAVSGSGRATISRPQFSTLT
jgi:hypothetical protein